MFTQKERDFYNPVDRAAACDRVDQINASMTRATDRLAMVLFGIERYGYVIDSELPPPPLHKDLALNLTDPANRQALREALDALESVQ